MTRKKYIKQLMALGVSRNRANAMATACRGPGGKSYAKDFADREQWLRIIYAGSQIVKGLTEGVAQAVAIMADAIRPVLSALGLDHGGGIND